VRAALRQHWPEYLIEAACLGIFMLSASLFGALYEHPASPVRDALASPFARRVLMGLSMGATAVALIYSPMGKRSGAHMNPAVTLTFLRLGKVKRSDAAFYVAAQVAGGLAGVLVAGGLLGARLDDPAVNWVATLPGVHGEGIAFAAEGAISFLLMTVVLWTSSRPRLERATGLFAGGLVALYIAFEAPLSGMSMNPARTLASAVPSGAWQGWWVYGTAPLLGMLVAAALYPLLSPARPVHCAKLHHANSERCIFCGANARPEPLP